MKILGVIITIVVIVALLIVVIVALWIFVFVIQSIRQKKQKNQTSNSSTSDQNLRDQFSAKRKIWFNNIDHQVEIPEFEYQEFIQIFPFFSNLEETKKYLENQNLSSEKIRETMSFLEEAQAKFNKVCQGADDRLLGQFQSSVLYLDANAVEFFSRYYLEFLNLNAYALTSLWYEEMLFHTINLALNHRSLNRRYLRAGLKIFLKGYKHDLDSSIDQLIQRMRSDLYKQNGTSYEDFANDFWGEFFQYSSSRSRANSNSGGYNGYQGEQSENSAHQDEVALNAAYKELGVKLDASDEQIKTAYRQLAKTYHPDKNPSSQARERMSRINAAYSLIKEQRDIK